MGVSCYRHRSHKRLINRRQQLEAKNRGKYVQLDEEKGGEDQTVVMMSEGSGAKAMSQEDTRGILLQQTKSASEASRSTVMAENAELRRDFAAQPHVEESPKFLGLNLREGHGLFLPPPPAVASYDSMRRQSLPSSRGSYDHGEDHNGGTGQQYDRSRSPSPGRSILSRSVSMLGPR